MNQATYYCSKGESVNIGVELGDIKENLKEDVCQIEDIEALGKVEELILTIKAQEKLPESSGTKQDKQITESNR